MSSCNTPQETAEAAVESGTAKASASPAHALVGGFLAGAYIAFGSLLAIVASAGLAPERWGGITTLVTGVTFSPGLILVVIAGADLLTGNMMLLPMALLRRRITVGALVTNWGVVLVGNLIGALVVTYFLADQTGVIGSISSAAGTPAASTFARLTGITVGKAVAESDYQVFLRAIGCKWMVCLGVWFAISAKDVIGKILGLLVPVPQGPTDHRLSGSSHREAAHEALSSGQRVHERDEQAGGIRSRVDGEPGVHGPGLHHGAAGRGEPPEPAAPGLAARRAVALAHVHHRGQGVLHGLGVGPGVQRVQPGAVQGHHGREVLQGAAVQHHPGVQALATLHPRHHPEQRVLVPVQLGGVKADHCAGPSQPGRVRPISGGVRSAGAAATASTTPGSHSPRAATRSPSSRT